MNSMKILMIIDRYAPIWGGAENQLKQLIPHLVKNGCNAAIVTRRWEKSMLQKDTIDGTPVFRVGIHGSGTVSTIWYVLSLLFFIVAHGRKFDCIHTHGAVALGALGTFAGKIVRKPCVVKIASAGRIPEMLDTIFGRTLLHIIKLTNALISLSEEIHEEMRNVGIGEERIVSMTNGVDVDRFHPFTEQEKKNWRTNRGLTETSKIVLFTGRLVYSKGIDIIINSWQNVISANPNTYLVILGNDKNQKNPVEARMKCIVKENEIGNVIFEGEISQPERYYSAADIYAFASRHEGCSNALLEAMAAALPIVSSDIGAVNKLIIHEETGLLVPQENSKAFADGIIQLLHNPVLCLKTGSAARRHVIENHSFSNISEIYCKIYKTLRKN